LEWGQNVAALLRRAEKEKNTMRSMTRTLVVAATLATAAEAQVATKRALTIEGARKVIGAAVAEAKRLGTTGVIAVVDDGGHLMALERIDGTFPAGSSISIGKARTAVLFKRPTKFFEDAVVAKGRTAMVALDDFTPLQGGVPIVLDGEIIGGVGVSGAASAAQDEELAIAGSNILAGSPK
jgi:glc operon protein GlcG